ncbi:uncharacterized protein LOC6578068 [Drosophila mojavensis]|uniref:Uncharacterized protein n=1 Tax=Drosophila mojavensis TaxID=7230 RepID=B4KID5_DROMO|nr:uncharacterized protein LOC6578068 [Drosophila mojavensis]EDW13432.1 uncharacterized protein Dmoj_GI20054 [Drosophila mojavensis]
MAAATASATSAIPKLYVSRATIQLRQPVAKAPPLTYEWRTQVTGQAQEAPVECIKSSSTAAAAGAAATGVAAAAAAAATPTYTPPRIQGNEAQRKQLPQTLSNFFAAERYDSAWNRLTK